ncbi:MAG: TIGR02757 family protein [Myxococcales bacterium]|nr:TIGR02757 family protein [Myxococcales bacterium]
MKATTRARITESLSGFDAAAHLERDPISFAHRYEAPEDKEVVALFAALLAYGRVASIARAVTVACERMGPAPSLALMNDDVASAGSRFEGFVHRLTRGEDLSRLWLGIGETRRRFGSLEAAFLASDVQGAPDYHAALTGLRQAIVTPYARERERQAFEHFLPDPRRGSACKRFCLFLRWMVRGPDEIDLGLWRGASTSRLVMPLDTHIHRIGLSLGLTKRRSTDWQTASEITRSLKVLDPTDPLRFDFALTHMGIDGDL